VHCLSPAAPLPSLPLLVPLPVQIFGAVASVLLIWILTGVLCYEAILRIITPEEVDGKVMFITAIIGVVVNLAMMKVLHQGGHGHSHGGDDHGHSHGDLSVLFSFGKKKAAKPADAAGGAGTALLEDDHHGHSHAGSGGGAHGHAHGSVAGAASGAPTTAAAEADQNINVRAAFIHAVGDLVQSIGVTIAAIIIWAYPEAHIADPICTFLFSILVLFTTWGIMKSAYFALMVSQWRRQPVAAPHTTAAGCRGSLARCNQYRLPALRPLSPLSPTPLLSTTTAAIVCPCRTPCPTTSRCTHWHRTSR